MAKALVIKGVDFSANKLDTVTLIEEIPCTSITLNISTLTLANIGTTSTLLATALPLNTTDAVSWTSSNARIVTVDQTGVVTVSGAGTATITVTCGTKSATCTVTTTHTLVMIKKINGTLTGKGTESNVRNAVIRANDNTSGHYGIAYQEDELTKKILPGYTGGASNIYPIYFRPCQHSYDNSTEYNPGYCCYYRLDKDTDGSDAYESMAAMWLVKDASEYDQNVPLGNRVITDIPNQADSVGFCFQKPDTSGGNISLEDSQALRLSQADCDLK